MRGIFLCRVTHTSTSLDVPVGIYPSSADNPMLGVFWQWDDVLAETSPLVFRGRKQLAALILEVFPSWRNVRATSVYSLKE